MGFLTDFSDRVSKTVIQQYSVFKAVSTDQESVLPSNTNSCCSLGVLCEEIILCLLWIICIARSPATPFIFNSVECLFTFAKRQF